MLNTPGLRLFAAAVVAIACALGAVHAGAQSPGVKRLTLAEAQRLMLERNRELQVARYAVAGAEADITIAGAPPNPVLTLGGARLGPGSGSEAGPLSRRVESSVGVSQLFERGGKRELRREAAELNAAAVRGDRTELERQQRLALAQAYYDLLLAQERSRVALETTGLFDKTLAAAQRRVQAGDLSRADLARLEVDALRARNEAQAIRLEQEKAQIALAYLIGMERESRDLAAAEGWPTLVAVEAAAQIDRVIEARAAVQAAQARLRAAERNRELAQALRTRDVTAGIQYDRTPADVTRNSVGVNVSVPLFTRYYYQGEVRRAEADWQSAEAGLQRVRAAAISEIAGAAAALDNAAQRVRRFNDALLAVAERSADYAEFAYTRGAIGVMDLLDSRRQLHATRLEAVAAMAEYARAHSAWRAATEPIAEPKP
jgi:cobalt-zinc-cadmium efflux system outer membrane protein